MTLLQHEDQASINLVFMQLRLTMNGGVEGNVVPKIMMTDCCGKLMRDILEELNMSRGHVSNVTFVYHNIDYHHQGHFFERK